MEAINTTMFPNQSPQPRLTARFQRFQPTHRNRNCSSITQFSLISSITLLSAQPQFKTLTTTIQTRELVTNHDVGFPSDVPNSTSTTIHAPSLGTSKSNIISTLGHHLARRLVEIGINDVFAVPGDSNLTLLDYLVAEDELNLIGCCNELNAGYATDGYARYKGVGACVVTFTVGGLSILNAIAGTYAEDLPIICIVGGPNSNEAMTLVVIRFSTTPLGYLILVKSFVAFSL